MKTALITGGLGFIGSNIVKQLIEKKNSKKMYSFRLLYRIRKST